MSRLTLGLGALALTGALVVSAAPLDAQTRNTLGVGAHFQGYDFTGGVGADAADLVIFPVAYRFRFGERLNADVYSAWARGTVEQDDRTATLSGFVDTRLRANYQFAGWGVLTLGANLPTGNSEQTAEEAVVAAVMSSDLLGFRAASWGTAPSFTTGVATASRLGEWGVGLGGSYRMSGDFEPSADTSLVFDPGNELRLRLGLDRNVGETGKFTAGFTFHDFTADQLGGRNLFQAGSRMRLDLRYAFRYEGGTWTAFVTDIWREEGDQFLQLVDQSGTVLGDSVTSTGSQNLIIAGLTGSEAISGSLRFRPMLELRVQDREEGPGSGVLVGFGGDVPLRLFGGEVFPRFRLLVGSIETAFGAEKGVVGGELGTTIRWRW